MSKSKWKIIGLLQEKNWRTETGELITDRQHIVASNKIVFKGILLPEMNELKSVHMADKFGRILSKEIAVQAGIEEVWAAWTTTEGVQSFFSRNAKVELRVGGEYEIYFQMDSPYGTRGSESCRILSYLPNQMLTFEWNAPPDFGDLRNQFTHVVILFDQPKEGKVRIRLSHLGWGAGEDWDKLYNYFDRAWSMVLQWFEKSMDRPDSDKNSCCD